MDYKPMCSWGVSVLGFLISFRVIWKLTANQSILERIGYSSVLGLIAFFISMFVFVLVTHKVSTRIKD